MADPLSPSAPRYNVATLLDIARIPAERIPAFLAELPRLIDQIRPFVEFADSAPEQIKLIAEMLVWVDDGITDGSSDETSVTFKSA